MEVQALFDGDGVAHIPGEDEIAVAEVLFYYFLGGVSELLDNQVVQFVLEKFLSVLLH